MESTQFLPTVSLRVHAKEQGSRFLGFAATGETDLATDTREPRGLTAVQVGLLAQEDGPVQRHRPRLTAGRCRPFAQAIGHVGVVSVRGGLVVTAVHRQRLVHQRPSPGHHLAPALAVKRGNQLRRLGELRLHGLEIAEVPGVDIDDLVVQFPHEDRGVVAFPLHSGGHLLTPVIEEIRTRFLDPIPPRSLLHDKTIAGVLAVEGTRIAAHGHALLVEEIQHLAPGHAAPVPLVA